MSITDEITARYQKNLLYFQKYYPDLYLKLSLHIENTIYDLMIENDGYFNIEHIANGNKLYSSNSELISQSQVDELLKNSKKIDKIIFSGTLLGFQIEKLILNTDIKCVMIIEPNIEFFKISAFLIDYETLLKNKFVIFSVQDNEEEIENKFLEFAFTMFYYNQNTSFLNSTPQYKPIVNFLENIIKNNISQKLTHLPKYIPNLKDTNLTELFNNAKKELKSNNFDKAIKLFMQVIEHERKNDLNKEVKTYIQASYLSLGDIFYSQKNIAEAFHCYGKCVSSSNIEQSIFEPALHNYAMINKNERHNYKKMVMLLREYLSRNPQNLSLAILLSEYLFQLNQYGVAQSLLDSYKDELIKNKRIEGMLPSIPIVYESQKEIDVFRGKLDNILENLLKQKISIPENNLTLINTFYLAYHNRNNASILTKLSNFYTHVTPSLKYISKHCLDYKHKGEKIKLGIISNYLVPGHPVMKFMKNIIEIFSKISNYEVHIFTFSNKTLKIKSVSIHTITTDIEKTRQIISKKKLDVIIYPEIGMHAPTYFLAHARLAPIQCMFAGHPMTSGIENMDYFLSHKYLEVKDAQEHYSEKLFIFENYYHTYKKPVLPKQFLSKKELGMLENIHNYLIPAKLQKIHPDFDKIIGKLVEKDNKANIILFEDSSETNWDTFVHSRLLKTVDKEHITFRPWADEKTYYSLLYHADAILEPIVFGYGTTARDALVTGAPIVTLPGRYSSNRATTRFYKKMGFEELISSNENQYIDKAIKLATSNQYREYCSKRILETNYILWRDADCSEVDMFFQKVLREYSNAK